MEIIDDSLNLFESYEVSLLYPSTGVLVAADSFTLSSNPVTPIRLDAVVASMRLEAESPASRIEPGLVTMELLSGLFYFQEATEVVISVVLSDGRRLIITDPEEIMIVSSDESKVSVDENVVIALESGDVVLTVSWIVCKEVLLSQQVPIKVTFDEFQPIFDPSSGSATVSEDSHVGAVITTVMAIDQDTLNIHADVQYAIRDDPYDGLFLVDLITGSVTLNSQLDREIQENYSLLIEATDQLQRQQLTCVPSESTTAPTPTDQPTTTPTETDVGSAVGSGDYLLPGTEEPKTATDPPTSNSACPTVGPISVFKVS